MRRPLLLVWTGVSAACTLVMWMVPGSETVPYHIAWATFALCYGLEQWSATVTAWGLGTFTLVTGAILVSRAASEVIDWQETAEIPLMLLLMVLMVWHVQRRNRALAAVTVLADRERREAQTRELLTQRTSHEMRSPLTIARGYLEVIMARTRDPEEAADLRIVDEELTRLTRVCDRLVRSMRIHSDLEVSTFDLDAVLGQTVDRWSTVADRSWRLETCGGTIYGSQERLRACLDTLVENAVRYTCPGDVVALHARPHGGDQVVIGVADSGPGFVDEVVRAVNARGSLAGQDLVSADLVRDDLSQTGLGLSLVCDVATKRGGRVHLGRSSLGGAEVAMVVPRRPPSTRLDLPVAASGDVPRVVASRPALPSR